MNVSFFFGLVDRTMFEFVHYVAKITWVVSRKVGVMVNWIVTVLTKPLCDVSLACNPMPAVTQLRIFLSGWKAHCKRDDLRNDNYPMK